MTRLLRGGIVETGELTPWVTRTGGFSSYLGGTGGFPLGSLESKVTKRAWAISFSLSSGKVRLAEGEIGSTVTSAYLFWSGIDS